MEPMTEDAATWQWMADDPLGNAGADPRSRYFDRTSFVATTASAMQGARGQSTSSVFGLIGAWGSGKTTLISALTSQLEAADWSVHHFNPWLYADADSLRWGFFSELREAMPAGAKWNNARKNVEKLRGAVVPLTKLASAIGPDMSGAAEYLLNPGSFSVTKMRDKVAKHLERLTEPVLVVLDDLDRLTSAELLETFKLVRFIGRLPNVYYLLCYDEKTLVDLLEKTDLIGGKNDGRALDYLEKIVQLRFDIPPLRVDLVEELFEAALRGIVEKNGITLTTRDESRLIELLRTGLVGRLTTPRAIRNLFAQARGISASGCQ
ncbi:KAP family NTPase [Cryobacterium breve]|uniref:KAP family NTPase n=1 Tax=Cryobacterium breve TaxID=1259258 RepID=A0ABY7NBH8_9MICO|nr:P-loop NTPase fold protein [Cryobacterium breve]WBM79862.1 KAP family NTPase [Cryobacterium breve]